ncbi:MAG: DUF2326 domain-containing protein, partial [Gammaproteobacteria bacterium]|nr:DUF2326 domain-containing protein [Gammaproteobacteria bacterium]
MIHGIYSNQASFKSVKFDKGLNVVIAERKEESDEKKTTNSRGKSTLIAIINFCLGSDANRSGLCIDELAGWNFTIDLTLLGKRVKVMREIDNPLKFLIKGDTKDWPIEPELDEETNNHFLGLDKWKRLLGMTLFDIPQASNLSTRSLLSYFMRSGNDAYSKPLKFFSNQADNAAHVYNTFFIGLEHKYANKWCELDKQFKTLKALDDAIKAGVHETQGELEARKIELEEELSKSRRILADFKVHERYKDIQTKANQLTKELHKLANQNVFERGKLNHYERAVTEEVPPDQEKLEAIYEETGLVFPDSVKRTLGEASAFHSQVIKNRAMFLEAEIMRIKNEIANREASIKTLNDRRAECMEILNTHGALEEYSRLQEEHTKIKEKFEQILNKIEDIRDKAKKRKAIKSIKLELDKEATIDYEEKREIWEQAIRLFNESAKSLYGVPGEFVIDISDKGYRFNVDIPGGRGGGIGKMKVFCYDLMVICCMQKILGKNIDFLLHDSIIYEGVDERQIAHAIEQAASKAKEYGFQYIITINSDMVPY